MLYREIDKNPIPPELSAVTIDLLTKLCFRHDSVGASDVIFEFATLVDEALVATNIEALLQKTGAKAAILTGGHSSHIYHDVGVLDKSEADLVGDLIAKARYPNVHFIYERHSTNLLDNVREAYKIYDFTQCKRLTFITKSHAAGRSYLSLRSALPNMTLYQATYPATYPGQKSLTAGGWHQTQFGRSRVWGEYMRIKTYGVRGDIPLQEVADMMADIKTALGDTSSS